MKYKVFIDGQAGTTGLWIENRLRNHPHVELSDIPGGWRKDSSARAEYINNADIAILCLPDVASIEAVSFLKPEGKTRIIDASTAHRTNPEWVYGLPELTKTRREEIKNARFVSVPGCHATGFNLGLYPLIESGLMPKDYPVCAGSVTGYSGGGRKMIEDYENPFRGAEFSGSRPYALALMHKHLPEMKVSCDLAETPHFLPVLGDFARGMAVSLQIHTKLLAKKAGARDIRAILNDYYAGERFVHVLPFGEGDYLDPQGRNNTNELDILVFGNDERALIIARFDNLGKGASGAALQNMNIMLGLPEDTGL